jgi:hypothetical protein
MMRQIFLKSIPRNELRPQGITSLYAHDRQPIGHQVGFFILMPLQRMAGRFSRYAQGTQGLLSGVFGGGREILRR